MAVYLAVVAAMLRVAVRPKWLLSAAIAVARGGSRSLCRLAYGGVISNWASHESDEVVLLSSFGAVLLVAVWRRGFMFPPQSRFPCGVALSGRCPAIAQIAAPLRDLFAASLFFSALK